MAMHVVSLEREFTTETFSAFFASKWLLRCMGSVVVLEVMMTSEAFAASSANERFFIYVNFRMFSQFRSCFETFGTLFANMFSFIVFTCRNTRNHIGIVAGFSVEITIWKRIRVFNACTSNSFLDEYVITFFYFDAVVIRIVLKFWWVVFRRIKSSRIPVKKKRTWNSSHITCNKNVKALCIDT